MSPPSASASYDLPEEWLRQSGSLHRLARAILGDEALSADAVQSACLSALQGPQRDRSAAWWRRAVRHRAIDVARQRGRMRAATEARGAPGAAPATDEVVEQLELQRTVLDAVASLDEKYRDVVFLRWFRGQSPSEIAARLDLPVKTVKTRLTRALSRLRQTLAARLGEGADGRGWQQRLGLLVGPAVAFEPTVSLGLKSLGATSGALVMKKLVITLIVVLGGLVAWQLLQTEQASSGGDGSRVAEGATVAGETEPGRRGADPTASDAEGGTGAVETTPFTAPRPATTGKLVVRAWWPEGDPAAEVAVVISRGDRPEARTARRVVTDAEGIARLDDLAPGPIRALITRGEGRATGQAEVEAGATAEISIKIKPGLAVQGVVRSKEGFSVPGASVWLTARGRGWLAGRIATRTDGEGRFRLRHVPKGQSLGAIADGWSPSELLDLDLVDTTESPVEIVLELRNEGAGLTGAVSDHEGSAVAGARVIARSPHPERRRVHDNGSFREPWGPRSTTTDEAGRFALSGLLPGKTVVSVIAPEHPPFEEAFVLEAGATREVALRLAGVAAVRGILRDTAGRPVVGGTVYAFREPIDETFLLMGQVRGGTSAGTVRATTDAEGRFVLEPLEAGELHLYAQAKKEPRRPMGEPVLFTKTRMSLAMGESREWNPRFDLGGVIEGTIAFRDGVPMKGVFVSAIEAKTRKRHALFSEDGSFRFVMLSAKRYDVRVQLDDPPPGTPALVARDVAPGSAPLRIVADHPSPDSIVPAAVTVRVEDRAGRIAGDAKLRVVLESTKTADTHRGKQDGEVWTFAVRYEDEVVPLALQGDRLIARGTAARITPGKDVDLGTLVTAPGGALRLKIPRDEATRHCDVMVFLGHAAVRRRLNVAAGQREAVEVEGLEPGPTKIKVIGLEIAAIERSVEIVAGETKTVEVRLQPAVAVPFNARWNFDRPITRLSLQLLRADGSVAETKVFRRLERRTEPLASRFRVPVGRFVLEATTDDGRRAEQPVVITRLEGAAPTPIVLELR